MIKIKTKGGHTLETVPLVKIIIDEKLVRDLTQIEVAKLLQGAGEGSWWNMKRLESETCRKRDWLLDNILLNPKYREEMNLITNNCEGGRWMFKAKEMRCFLDKNFHHLNRNNVGTRVINKVTTR